MQSKDKRKRRGPPSILRRGAKQRKILARLPKEHILPQNGKYLVRKGNCSPRAPGMPVRTILMVRAIVIQSTPLHSLPNFKLPSHSVRNHPLGHGGGVQGASVVLKNIHNLNIGLIGGC